MLKYILYVLLICISSSCNDIEDYRLDKNIKGRWDLHGPFEHNGSSTSSGDYIDELILNYLNIELPEGKSIVSWGPLILSEDYTFKFIRIASSSINSAEYFLNGKYSIDGTMIYFQPDNSDPFSCDYILQKFGDLGNGYEGTIIAHCYFIFSKGIFFDAYKYSNSDVNLNN